MNINTATKDLQRLYLALPRLNVFPELGCDGAVTGFLDMLGSAFDDGDAVRFYQAYSAFVQILRGRNWPEYLVECLLRSRPERHGMTWEVLASSPGLRRDLRIVQQAASLDPVFLKEWAAKRWPELSDGSESVFSGYLSLPQWPCWQADNSGAGFMRSQAGIAGAAAQWLYRKHREFGAAFWHEADWADNAPRLCEHMSQLGTGIFQDAVALCWEPNRGLVPVQRPDPVALENLFRQEHAQDVIRENTEKFLQGCPAADVLVYGSRGTGKSSLVKALLNAYAERGLRLIQVPRKHLAALPEIAGQIAEAPLKFIVFVDDLSFAEHESDYRELKSLLEGGVAARPQNMLVYATSNRRHLLPETFAERGEVHGQDLIDEKLSLADRFGITVTFLRPDQQSYLAIVRGLAEQAGLIEPEDQTLREKQTFRENWTCRENGTNQAGPFIDRWQLEEQALQWAIQHNGRSGRTARQFVDSLLRSPRQAKAEE